MSEKFQNYISKYSKVERDAVLEAPVRLYGSANIKRGVTIGRFSYINRRTTVARGTKIGRFCSIGKNVEISVFDHPMEWLSSSPVSYNLHLHFPDEKGLFVQSKIDRKKAATIGNDVWISSNSVILRGVTIGDGCVVGAGSIVTRDVPPYSIVAGTPARLIRKRFDDETIERLLSTAWWDRPLEVLSTLSFDDIASCLESLEALELADKEESLALSKTEAAESNPETEADTEAEADADVETDKLTALRASIQDIEAGIKKPPSEEKVIFASLLSDKLRETNASEAVLEFVNTNTSQLFHDYDYADYYDQMALNNKVLQIVESTRGLDEADALPAPVQKTVLNILVGKG